MGIKRTGIRWTGSSWEMSFMYLSARRRVTYKLEHTKANFNWLVKEKARIEEAIIKGTFDFYEEFPNVKGAKELAKFKGSVVTVGDKLDDYLELKRKTKQKSTIVGYASVVKILKEEFGDIPLSQLNRVHVKNWITNQKITRHTAHEKLRPLLSVMADAYDEQIIPSNPLERFTFEMEYKAPPPPPIDPFDPIEMEKILSTADERMRYMIDFAVWTGLRTSELFAAQWTDIDNINKYLHVRRKRVRGEDSDELKTRGSNRLVMLHDHTLEILEKQKKFTYFKGKYIFETPEGKPFKDSDQFHGMFQRILMRAGVRYRKPYNTRHTFASMMLTAGYTIYEVADEMGHTSGKTVEKHYGKIIKVAQKKRSNRMREMYEDVINDTQLK